MNYVLGIDFGGGSSKATLMSETGVPIATNSVEYQTFYPQPGFAEQNPEDWYEATKKNIREIICKSGIKVKNICALSLDAATHTAVICDENFKVLKPSIYWTDIRSVQQVSYLRDNYLGLIQKQSLHTPGTIWTLPQLMWIRDNEPKVWKRVKKIMFAKDYVRHKLTGDYVTDFIEAQGSMLFDFEKNAWSTELLDILGFKPEQMPRVVKPTDIIGAVTSVAAIDTGLTEGTPVLCGTTDTVMEVFAAGAVNKGQMTLKLATAGRICVVTDQAFADKNLVTYSHVADGMWYPGTATKAAASSLRWYRDTFGDDYTAIDAEAAKVPVGSDGLQFHPYLNGELTPYQDPKLKASFTGVTAAHTKANFSRAVLEGVAFSLLDCKRTLEQLGIHSQDFAMAIGGGCKSALWRQIVSDCLGITLVQTENSDSSFGSCMLSGIAAGFFASPQDAVKKCVQVVSETKPNPKNTILYAKYYNRYKKVHDCLAPVYKEEIEDA